MITGCTIGLLNKIVFLESLGGFGFSRVTGFIIGFMTGLGSSFSPYILLLYPMQRKGPYFRTLSRRQGTIFRAHITTHTWRLNACCLKGIWTTCFWERGKTEGPCRARDPPNTQGIVT